MIEIKRILGIEIPEISNRETAEDFLDLINKQIDSGDGKLREMLSGLASEGVDPMALSKKLGTWSAAAVGRDSLAREALVVVGGSMWRGLRKLIPDEETRAFVAASACSILGSLDYGTAAKQASGLIENVITPVVSFGNTLGVQGKMYFLRAKERYPYAAHPYNAMRRLAGFKRV